MTTPATLGRIIGDLRDRLAAAESDAQESHKEAMNSYGAGYDRGFADAIQQIIIEITGEEL